MHNHTHTEAAHSRVAIIADEIGELTELEHTLAQVRARGVPGVEIDVIGTGPHADRRLVAVAHIELPFAAGESVAVPRIADVGAALGDAGYDVVHVCTPGPAGSAALFEAHAAGLPVTGCFHTELVRHASAPTLEPGGRAAELLASFYRHCTFVLSPGTDSDATLDALGTPGERIRRLERGVDIEWFSPARYCPEAVPQHSGGADHEIAILQVGELGPDRGTGLLLDGFALARERDPRLRLVIAGDGAGAPSLRTRLGDRVTVLGAVDRMRLAQIYATADLLVFPGGPRSDLQPILEAQASGLPVLAVQTEGCADLVENGRSGCLIAPRTEQLADAINGLVRRTTLLERLATGGLLAVRHRSWAALGTQLMGVWAEARATVEPELEEVVRAA